MMSRILREACDVINWMIRSSVQAVGVEQHYTAAGQINLPAHIFQVGPQSDGSIRLLDVEEGELSVGIADDGRIMSGIAIFYPSLFQVVNTDEHGDKHTHLVVFR